RVAVAGPRLEGRRVRVLCAARHRSVPGVEVDHRAGVVAEVPQEPPEPLRTAERAVGDHEDAGADPGPPRCLREVGCGGQRMAAAGAGRSGEVALDVEESGSRDVPCQVLAAAPVGILERPTAVDEGVAHAGKLERSSAAETPDAARSTALVHHSVVFWRSPAARCAATGAATGAR